MKWLKMLGLGILIWGLGLIWPEINEVLTQRLMISAVIGLGAIVLVYILVSRDLDGNTFDPNIRLEAPRLAESHATRPIRPV